MNILQLGHVFEMQNENLNHRIEIEIQNKERREKRHFNTKQVFEYRINI